MIETVVALVVLGAILVITITAVSTAFRTLGSAKETDVANNIGQARVEAIRSLPFTDVGTVGGSPAGTVAADETVEVQGVELQVNTSVSWVGSASGLDLVPTGGDGVPGFFNPGIDYKLVTVTVTPTASGDPIVFETIIAPPNVAAAEDAANLIVLIAKDEPAWAASASGLPRVYLHPPASLVAGPLNDPEPLFADIEDGVAHDIRIGPGPDDTSDGTWVMADPDLSATVGAATTLSEVLTVYRPIVLAVRAEDDSTSTGLADASVVVTAQATGQQMTFGPADMTAPGEWEITDLGDGVPLRHGAYTYVVSAPGYVTSGDVTVAEAPSGYPLDLTESTTVPLEASSTETITFTVTDEDGRPLNGATVSVTPDVSAPYSVTAGETGEIVLELEEDEEHDLDFSSPYGHEPFSITDVEGDDLSSTVGVALDTPASSALFILTHSTDAPFGGRYQYRQTGSTGDDWLEAKANEDGRVSVVVTQHALDGWQSRWEARVLCDADSSTGDLKQRSYFFLFDQSREFSDSCPAS